MDLNRYQDVEEFLADAVSARWRCEGLVLELTTPFENDGPRLAEEFFFFAMMNTGKLAPVFNFNSHQLRGLAYENPFAYLSAASDEEMIGVLAAHAEGTGHQSLLRHIRGQVIAAREARELQEIIDFSKTHRV